VAARIARKQGAICKSTYKRFERIDVACAVPRHAMATKLGSFCARLDAQIKAAQLHNPPARAGVVLLPDVALHQWLVLVLMTHLFPDTLSFFHHMSVMHQRLLRMLTTFFCPDAKTFFRPMSVTRQKLLRMLTTFFFCSDAKTFFHLTLVIHQGLLRMLTTYFCPAVKTFRCQMSPTRSCPTC